MSGPHWAVPPLYAVLLVAVGVGLVAVLGEGARRLHPAQGGRA